MFIVPSLDRSHLLLGSLSIVQNRITAKALRVFRLRFPDGFKPVAGLSPENGLMTGKGVTMRAIPTTVSVGAIGISDTTGINR
jgi:hypothetical protein